MNDCGRKGRTYGWKRAGCLKGELLLGLSLESPLIPTDRPLSLTFSLGPSSFAKTIGSGPIFRWTMHSKSTTIEKNGGSIEKNGGSFWMMRNPYENDGETWKPTYKEWWPRIPSSRCGDIQPLSPQGRSSRSSTRASKTSSPASQQQPLWQWKFTAKKGGPKWSPSWPPENPTIKQRSVVIRKTTNPTQPILEKKVLHIGSKNS